MTFKKGNEIWKLADPEKVGRPPRWKTPKELWASVHPYFDHQDENPIISTEITSTSKGSFLKEIHHKKPYTWQGLYVFLGVPNLDHYKEKDEFSAILTHIGNIIYSQKFDGAAAGVFNANIIARDLGLRDNKDVTTNGNDVIILPSNGLE